MQTFLSAPLDVRGAHHPLLNLFQRLPGCSSECSVGPGSAPWLPVVEVAGAGCLSGEADTGFGL